MVVKCGCGVRYNLIDNKFEPIICANCGATLTKPHKNYVKPIEVSTEDIFKMILKKQILEKGVDKYEI